MDNSINSSNDYNFHIKNQTTSKKNTSIYFRKNIPADSCEISFKGAKKESILSKLVDAAFLFVKDKPKSQKEQVEQKQSQINSQSNRTNALKAPHLPKLMLSDSEIEDILKDLDENQLSKFIEVYTKKIWFAEHLASVELEHKNDNSLTDKDKDKLKLSALKDFVTDFYDESNPALFNKALNSVYNYNKTIDEVCAELKPVSENIELKPIIKPVKVEEPSPVKLNNASKVDVDTVIGKMSESLYLFEQADDVGDNYWKFYHYSSDLNSKSTDDFINIFKETIEKSGKDFNQNDLALICKNFMYDKNSLSKVNYGDIDNSSIDRVASKLLYIGEAFANLQNIILNIPKSNSELSSDYIQRIINEYSKSVDKKNTERENIIKSRLEFSQEPENVDKIELSNEEKQKLADTINSWNPKSNKFNIDTPMSDLSYKWKQKYVLGGILGMDSKLEDACLQEFKRYSSAEDKFSQKPNQPVYRWMNISGNTLDFLNKMPAEGEIYSPEKIQSCSKISSGAETCFHNNNSSMNVKFVIYPKSETSKAYDIGEGKYGDLEVIYPSNSKFKVLYKDIEEIKHNEKIWVPAMESNTKTGSHIQAVIYLQEV